MATTTKDNTIKSDSLGSAHVPSSQIEAAAKIISSATQWAAATSLIPVPFVDLAALAAVQVKMVIDLSNQYGHAPSKEAVRCTISVLLGTLLPSGIASYTTGVVARGVPGVGLVVGVVSFGGFAAISTYAIGKVFVRHFEDGGSFASFSPEAVSDSLRREVAAAKA